MICPPIASPGPAHEFKQPMRATAAQLPASQAERSIHELVRHAVAEAVGAQVEERLEKALSSGCWAEAIEAAVERQLRERTEAPGRPPKEADPNPAWQELRSELGVLTGIVDSARQAVAQGLGERERSEIARLAREMEELRTYCDSQLSLFRGRAALAAAAASSRRTEGCEEPGAHRLTAAVGQQQQPAAASSEVKVDQSPLPNSVAGLACGAPASPSAESVAYWGGRTYGVAATSGGPEQLQANSFAVPANAAASPPPAAATTKGLPAQEQRYVINDDAGCEESTTTPRAPPRSPASVCAGRRPRPISAALSSRSGAWLQRGGGATSTRPSHAPPSFGIQQDPATAATAAGSATPTTQHGGSPPQKGRLQQALNDVRSMRFEFSQF